ncbi:MAG: lipopolysaccharide biosynthesis protein [Bacteroidales bacterium]
MTTDNLKHKTVKALAWSFVDKFGQQIVYLISGVVLARILTQADYGLTGMLAIFIALSNVLLDSGFGSALVKKQDATRDDINAIFYFNVFVSITLYGLLYFSAPLIAHFYEEPQLILLSRVLFLTILFNAFNLIQNTLLTKSLRFNQLAKINFTALLLSSGIAVGMAVKGYGVWALVAQTVLLSLFKSLLLWGFNSWRPSWGFKLEPLKEAFSFSSKMLLSGVINVVFNNIYSVIIGKFFNKVELGYYQQASKFNDIPSTLISNTFRTVALPVFANVNSDNERLGRVLQKTNKSIAFILFPILFGLLVVSEPLLIGLIGEKWLPSVSIFRILLLSGFFTVFSFIFNELLVAKGKSRTYLRVEMARKVFLILAVAGTFHWGVNGLAFGWVLYSLAGMLLGGYFACKVISYRFGRFFLSIAPYFLLAGIMGASVWSLKLLHWNEYLTMAVQMVAGALIYGAGILLFRLEMGEEVMRIVKKIKKKKP